MAVWRTPNSTPGAAVSGEPGADAGAASGVARALATGQICHGRLVHRSSTRPMGV